MKKRFFTKIVSSLIICTAVIFAANSATAKVHRWKLQTYVPEPAAFFKGYITPFIKEIKEKTNGQIVITAFPVGAIVAPQDLMTATAEGLIECALATTGYDTGIIPEAYAATNLPYGWADTDQPVDFWYNNKEAWGILDKAYSSKNVKLIALLNPADPMTFFTMFPVKKVSDFKGKKIRSSGNWASMVSNTGASQVNMGLGEVYQALEKGLIDGVFMAASGLSDFKWNEVVKYVMEPAVMVGGGADFIVNLEAFNELSPKLQKIFVETAREADHKYLIPYTTQLTIKATKDAKALGVKYVTLPNKEVSKMRNAALGMWEKIDTLNSKTARQMKMMRKYLDSKGAVYPKR